jgi:hypothetical protein
MFAEVAIALYVGHHVGDYWIQSHHQALTKGEVGREGRLACLSHILSYLLAQAVCLSITSAVLGLEVSNRAVWLALAISGITHWMADRRDHGLMFWLARRMPWKHGYLEFGAPRPGHDDNPTLSTGAWSLDQSWHIFWGVFVAALVIAGLS